MDVSEEAFNGAQRGASSSTAHPPVTPPFLLPPSPDSVHQNLASERQRRRTCNEQFSAAVNRIMQEQAVVSHRLQQQEHRAEVLSHQMTETVQGLRENVRLPVDPQRQKKTARLPRYDGSYSADVFSDLVSRTALYNQWEENATFLNLIAALDGLAKTTVLSHFGPGVRPSSQTVLEVLKDRFGSTLLKGEAAARLRHRRQGKGETLRDVACDIQMLVAHAYPGADQRTKDDIATQGFISAVIDDELRKLLALAKPGSLREAVGAAEEISVTLQAVKPQKSAVLALQDMDGDNGNLPAQLQELKRELADLKMANAATVKTMSGSAKCFRCGGVGHFAKECPSKRGNGDQGNGYPRGARRDVSRANK